jgi:hypothetical protein
VNDDEQANVDETAEEGEGGEKETDKNAPETDDTAAENGDNAEGEENADGLLLI